VNLRLSKLLSLSESGHDTSPSAVDLLAKLEIWLKSILWIAIPRKWESAQQRSEQAKADGKPSRFNLYQVIQDLGLLTEHEIQTPVERCLEIPDSARRMILCAKEDRNPLEHDGSEIPHHVRQRLLSSCLVSYLAPVIRYQADLQVSLRGVVTHAPDFGGLTALARQIDSERRGHIERFAGRDEWLKILKDKLSGNSDQAGSYILLTATEGTGKSAIVSMLSQQLASAIPVLGSHSTYVQKVAPWLPAVILHLGKASNLPSEILPFLLEQIRCQLVCPLHFEGDAFPESQVQESMDRELRRMVRDSSSSKYDAHTVTDTEQASYLAVIGRGSSDRGSGYLLARRVLFDALERLVAETAKVVLLIDALEEISTDGSNLGFLPERLPPGVTCLLTSRPQTPAEAFVRSHLKNVEPIELKQMKREEIPLLTQVSDHKPGGREFNDKVMESSDGLPLLVAGIARHVIQEKDITKVPVRGVRDRHFELKASEWSESGETNLHILGLLAIFEPVMPIDLAYVQAYLDSQTIFLELAEIRSSLKPVSTQLQGLDISRVKLAMRPFAEYIRERFYSPKDLFIRFKRVVDWLIKDSDVDSDLFGRLFMVWTNLNSADVNKSSLSRAHRELLEHMPTILLEEGREELLFKSALRLMRETEKVHPVAVECLRNAAHLGSLDAMRTFSNLIDGEVSDELKQEAIGWVRKGAEQGDAASMMIMGNRLIDGTGMNKDVETGSEWLRKSAEAGYPRGMMSFGMRLVNGDGLERSPEEGLQWLQKASREDNVAAQFLLGRILFEGDNVEQDIESGVAHLEKAAELGYVPAIRYLSNQYLKGINVDKNIDRGIALLEKAISLDDESAILTLARNYLTGECVEKSEDKGLAILEKGVAKNQTAAKRALGYELVTGKNVSTPNHDRGATLLKEAIEAGDAPSMEIMADFLLDVKKSDGETAKDLLIRATEAGYDSALVNLAKRLAEGKGLSKDTEYAMSLLRKYAKTDRIYIRWELGRALIEGSYGEQNLPEGESVIEALCHEGDLSAKRYLGIELLEGHNLAKDIAKGLAHLESAVSDGDTDAMIALGNYLIETGDSAEEQQEGERLLRRAHDAGDFEASFELGMLLLNGEAVSCNAEEGIRLIQKADRYNYIPAMVFVAKELICGKRLQRDDDAAKAKLIYVGRKASSKLTDTGLEFYQQGLNDWAAWCFLTAFKAGGAVAGNNLAYMIRRGEVSIELGAPNPLALLAKGAEEGNAYALVNQALCYAAGIGASMNWRNADKCIQKVTSLAEMRSSTNGGEEPDHPVQWWHSLTRHPMHAAEGHLVVGWLVFHGKIEDPDGMEAAERFRLASVGGWDVPATFFTSFSSHHERIQKQSRG
jgi:TPR repeat protein